MKRSVAAAGCAVLAVAECLAMQAGQGPVLKQVDGPDYSFSVQAGIMLQSGESRELVFDGSHKLSELIWDISGLALAGGSVSTSLGASFKINAGLWIAINEGNGSMVDYDWFVPGYDWTHFSKGDVEINSAYLFDVNGDYTFWSCPMVSLYGICGYKRLLWDWSEYGQSYIYSEFGFRDDRGYLDGENGIDYEQVFDIPYLGLGSSLHAGRLSATAYFLYSPLVQAEDYDHHILRGIKFSETYENIDYIGFGGQVSVELTDTLFIAMALDGHMIPEARGDMIIYDMVNGEIDAIPGAGGLENSVIATTLLVGLRL